MTDTAPSHLSSSCLYSSSPFYRLSSPSLLPVSPPSLSIHLPSPDSIPRLPSSVSHTRLSSTSLISRLLSVSSAFSPSRRLFLFPRLSSTSLLPNSSPRLSFPCPLPLSLFLVSPFPSLIPVSHLLSSRHVVSLSLSLLSVSSLSPVLLVSPLPSPCTVFRVPSLLFPSAEFEVIPSKAKT